MVAHEMEMARLGRVAKVSRIGNPRLPRQAASNDRTPRMTAQTMPPSPPPFSARQLSDERDAAPFLRHIRATRNAGLPGRRLVFRLGDHQVGWLDPSLRACLLQLGAQEDGDGLNLADAGALAGIASRFAREGLFRDRNEMFDVRAMDDGAVLARIDRGALPAFGIEAHGVHLNGLVRRTDGLHLWVARRGADRPLDPGKLDHLVAGGIGAGMDALTTLEKEAGEEAGLAPEMARQAVPVSSLAYAMERDEGLRRDRLFCFDLELPESFVPRPVDGEAAGFELWPIGQVLERVRTTDDFKFNVNLALIDLFLRHGLLRSPALRLALDAPA
jgi:8-oxo-dGTP pyrophosphatase MutT (NUDIX family)